MTTFPSGLLPMKAVNGTLLPEDDGGWAFEIKWDGMRLLAYVDSGAATPLRLQTTRGARRAGRRRGAPRRARRRGGRAR